MCSGVTIMITLIAELFRDRINKPTVHVLT